MQNKLIKSTQKKKSIGNIFTKGGKGKRNFRGKMLQIF